MRSEEPRPALVSIKGVCGSKLAKCHMSSFLLLSTVPFSLEGTCFYKTGVCVACTAAGVTMRAARATLSSNITVSNWEAGPKGQLQGDRLQGSRKAHVPRCWPQENLLQGLRCPAKTSKARKNNCCSAPSKHLGTLKSANLK